MVQQCFMELAGQHEKVQKYCLMKKFTNFEKHWTSVQKLIVEI